MANDSVPHTGFILHGSSAIILKQIPGAGQETDQWNKYLIQFNAPLPRSLARQVVQEEEGKLSIMREMIHPEFASKLLFFAPSAPALIALQSSFKYIELPV